MWMDNPSRLIVGAISVVVFMIGAVLFGEGNKQKQLELQKQTATVQPGKAATDKAEPAPKPAAPAAAPAQAPTTSANDLRP